MLLGLFDSSYDSVPDSTRFLNLWVDFTPARVFLRAIINLPVPAHLLNQYKYITLSLLSHPQMFCNKSVRVPDR
jgi:hypothetical protein